MNLKEKYILEKFCAVAYIMNTRVVLGRDGQTLLCLGSRYITDSRL